MRLAAFGLCFLLCACSLTPTQKKYVAMGASILVIGAIAAHDSSNGPQAPQPIGPPPGCRPQPDGSCR